MNLEIAKHQISDGFPTIDFHGIHLVDFLMKINKFKMSGKIKKQFGIWMDTQHAIVVGKETESSADGSFKILATEKSEGHVNNSSENASNNADRNSLQKLFKNITSHMQNVDEVHVTGTGTAQEQFIHYLKETPHYKNVVATESTSNKMSNEALIEFITAKF